MEAALIHADGRTEMTELIGTFRNYANAPVKSTRGLPAKKQ